MQNEEHLFLMLARYHMRTCERLGQGTHAPLLQQWNVCEAACTATSFDCTRERRTCNDIALDPHHHHRFRSSLGGVSHLQRKKIGCLPDKKGMAPDTEDGLDATLEATSQYLREGAVHFFAKMSL